MIESQSGNQAKSNPLLAAVRVAGLFLVSFFYLMYFYLTYFVAPSGDRKIKRLRRFTHRWAKSMAWAAGIKVKVYGNQPPQGSLITPNHLGYGDILALLAATESYMVARVEVAKWPVIGTLVKTSQQIVVHREEPKEMIRTVKETTERIGMGHNVAVFLEGTSTGGDDVLPFMPSLCQPCVANNAPAIPVAICWKPKDPKIYIPEDIAYWKDHEFGAHIWRFLGFSGKVVEIYLGEPVQPEGFNRKELAKEVRRQVVELYEAHRLPKQELPN